MFALTPKDYDSPILGCGDGPASFNSENFKLGRHIVSVDPIYIYSGDEIGRRFDQVADSMISQVRATPDDWVWGYHTNPDALLKCRRRSLELFLADYETGRATGRYVTGALPSMPFSDKQFGLALCSHLLFLYSEILDSDFHVAAVREMCRVAREVRIFPLLTIARRRSDHIELVQKALHSDGWMTEIVKVDYELQKGGNEMLRIYRD